MARYIARRLLQIPLLFLGATLLTFALVHLVPGSPVNDLRVSIPGITESDLARIERTLGLDEPLHKQYLGWLGQLVQGDLGLSLQDRRPVRDEIMTRLPNTLLLTGSALFVSLLIAIPIGILAALRRNSIFDQVVNLAVTLGSALPTFWIGLILILVFSVQATEWGLPALPSSGMRSVVGGEGLGDRLEHLLLPMTTLAIFNVSGWLRYVRAQMLEVLSQEYIKTARSKGLAERVVIFRHAFRNALLPLVTLLGIQFPQLVAGAAFVETIFSWPGLGSLSVQAATDRDYTMIIGLTVFVAAFTLISNLVTDLLYALVDPQITYQ
ncbi:MAG: ABC transporter permease [Thermomicrobiales bacterium]|nr:ABC transporter permease [Thermomicrobiales bacterium]